MEQKQDWLKLGYHPDRKKIEAQLNSINFKDHDSIIVYIPSLNLSAYGANIEEAHKMMKDVVIPDFCETLLEQPLDNVLIDLKSLGWSQSPFFKKELSKTSYISKEGLLKTLNISKDVHIEESLLTV